MFHVQTFFRTLVGDVLFFYMGNHFEGLTLCVYPAAVKWSSLFNIFLLIESRLNYRDRLLKRNDMKGAAAAAVRECCSTAHNDFFFFFGVTQQQH